jgi:hypothetical protein
MHTHFSDGLASPEALVRHAASIGLRTIAITDHDNTRGSREARPVAAELGLTLIPAVEFATGWEGYGWPEWGSVVDLLGYFIDPDHPAFRALEEAALAEYFSQLEDARLLAVKMGYPVTMEEAIAISPHYPSVYSMAEALVAKGAVTDEDAALDDLLKCWRDVCVLKFSIYDVIETIHAAGGAAVLAHPSIVLRPDGDLIRAEDVARLVEAGLDGIEVYHYRLPEEATRQHFLDLARAFDLAVTGGSDEHGRPAGSFTRMGSQPITEEMVAELKSRCGNHRGR